MSDLIRNSGVYQRLTSSTQELERLFKEVDEKKNPPDIKKILLLMGLGTLSWISTYSGLLELITANSGDIPLTYKLAIGFAVAMLMLMIVYILDQLFAPLNWLLRTIYIFGYIFLTIISVGFGFGFYWKFLESRSEATRSAESAVTQVQTALQGGQSRLEQLESTLISLTALSSQKATEEREKGNSCPNSRPGDGPRRRLRDADAKNFSFAGDFVTKRAQTVANDIKTLNADLAKIASRHPSTIDPTTGTRNAFMKGLNQRLDMTITRFNAFRTDPQLASIRNNLAERSNTTIFPDGRGGTFKCPDNQLQTALRGVVQAFDQLPTLQKPKIAAVEGSEATIEAFRRLGATLAGMAILKMPPSEDELREMRKKAVRSLDQKKGPSAELNAVQPGLNERDYIPLAIAVFVDFCLLLVSINRPMDRLKSLVPVMKEARDGPISGILSSFHATHFTAIREEFSLFQHVVFDWGGHYYVAVPLASNDVQAQYLANLFVSLEGRGIVDRAMIPPAFIIRGKLKKMGSSFAEHRAFRLYKFRNGAWSNIVLDAVMGAAKDVAAITQTQQKNAQLGHNDNADQTDRNANFESLFNGTPITVTTLNGNGLDGASLTQASASPATPDGKELAPKNNNNGHLPVDADFTPIEQDTTPLKMPRLFRTGKYEEPEEETPAEKSTPAPDPAMTSIIAAKKFDENKRRNGNQANGHAHPHAGNGNGKNHTPGKTPRNGFARPLNGSNANHASGQLNGTSANANRLTEGQRTARPSRQNLHAAKFRQTETGNPQINTRHMAAKQNSHSNTGNGSVKGSGEESGNAALDMQTDHQHQQEKAPAIIEPPSPLAPMAAKKPADILDLKKPAEPKKDEKPAEARENLTPPPAVDGTKDETKHAETPEQTTRLQAESHARLARKTRSLTDAIAAAKKASARDAAENASKDKHPSATSDKTKEAVPHTPKTEITKAESKMTEKLT